MRLKEGDDLARIPDHVRRGLVKGNGVRENETDVPHHGLGATIVVVEQSLVDHLQAYAVADGVHVVHVEVWVDLVVEAETCQTLYW